MIQIVITVGKLDVLIVCWYLNRYAFSYVQDELHIGIVVVICPSWHRHVMIGHLDVLCERQSDRKPCFSRNRLAAVTFTEGYESFQNANTFNRATFIQNTLECKELHQHAYIIY